jgi:O-antigen ligase
MNLPFVARLSSTSHAIANVRLFLAIAALCGLLVGRFWWPGETTAWAGFIRACLFLGLIVAFAHIGRVRDVMRNNPYAWCLLGFCVYLALNSLILGDGKAARRIVLLIALFVSLVVVVARGRDYLRGVLVLMTVVSAGVAIFTLFNHWQLGLLFKGYRVGAIADSGLAGLAEFENSVLASLQMAFSLVAAIWLIVNMHGWPRRLALSICCVPIAVYLYATFGRSGWMAAAIACALILSVLSPAAIRKKAFIATVALIVIVLAMFHERIAYELFQRSLTHRDEIWIMVIGLMPGYWLFGHGADISVEQLLGVQKLGGVDAVINHSHSIYVEVLFNYGFVGLFALLAVLFGALAVLWRKRGDGINSLWFAVLLAASVVMAVDFSSFVSTPNLLWLWVWLPLGWAFAITALPPDRPGQS